MGEIEGDGIAEFNIEDLTPEEHRQLKRAIMIGKGEVSIYAYVYLDIDPPERE